MLTDDELARMRRTEDQVMAILADTFSAPTAAARLLDEVDRLRALVPDSAYLWITPGRRGGRVCIGGQNVTAEAVAERVWAEGDVECAMDEWGLSRDVVLMACWWWVGYRGHISPTRDGVTQWGRWRTWANAYARNPGEAPDPPEVA